MNFLPPDVRFGARMLAKRPGTTLLAVLTLAIGVGANTAAFSLLTTFLLRPLPYEAPDRVVVLSGTSVETNADVGVSLPELLLAREVTDAFSTVAAAAPRPLLLERRGDEPESLAGADVTPTIGDVLGVRPAIGRLFTVDDAREGAGVAALTYGAWQRRFGGDPGVLGRTIVVDRRPVVIVGVLPPLAQFPGRDVELWLPAPIDGPWAGRSATTVARLADGVTLEDARGRLRAISTRLDPLPASGAHVTLGAERLDELAVGKVRNRMVLLQVTVLFVLLIACANLASIRLALASARTREVAVRSALGAGRWRVARQFLVENLILAVAGGLAGVLVASGMLKLLVAAAPDRVSGLDTVGIDARMLGFALLVSLGSGVVFGIVPALHAAAADPMNVLRSGSGGSVAVVGRDRLRSALLVVEVALTVVLLVGSALVMRAYWRLEGVPTGFDDSSAVAVDVALPEAIAPDDARVDAFYREAIERVRAVPGVDSAGAVDIMPLVGWNPGTDYVVDGADANDPPARADLQPITPDYFRAMGIPIVAGRPLSDAERDRREPVAVVNACFAHVAWPEAEAVGRRLRLVGETDREGGRWLTVVGVVGDVRQFGVQEAPRPEIYVAGTRRTMTVIARTTSDAATLAPSVAAAVRSAAVGLPRLRVRTLAAVTSDALAVKRLSAIVFGTLAGLATALAALGLFGIVAHAVARRTREIGVRVALGARAPDVVRAVLGPSLCLTAAGLALGLLGAAGVTRFLRAYLFGTSALDPLAFAGGAAALLLVALLAAWGPARAALRVDPMVALREE